MTQLNQSFTIYQGMARELAFTVTGIEGAVDVTAATWEGGGLEKSLGDGIEVTDGSEASTVTVTVTLLPDETADLAPGAWQHQLVVTDGEAEPDMAATGTMTVRRTL